MPPAKTAPTPPLEPARATAPPAKDAGARASGRCSNTMAPKPAGAAAQPKRLQCDTPLEHQARHPQWLPPLKPAPPAGSQTAQLRLPQFKTESTSQRQSRLHLPRKRSVTPPKPAPRPAVKPPAPRPAPKAAPEACAKACRAKKEKKEEPPK
jgi:hypothetical protein